MSMAATGAEPELELMPVPPTAAAQNMPPDEADEADEAEEAEEAYTVDPRLHRRTLAKLDCLLLPFLALIFLFNALDKANVGQNHPPRQSCTLTKRRNRLETPNLPILPKM